MYQVEKRRRGPRGRHGVDGVDGSDASVTNASVNAAIATDPSSTRAALGLGYFATGTDASNLTGTVSAARIADGSLSIAKTSGLQTALDGKQPLHATLTAIAGTATTTFGRNLLNAADAADLRSRQSLGSASLANTGDFAPASHVGAGGTEHAVVVASGAAGFMSGADKAKLNGVASGATANSSDATLLARANHTGTQPMSTISDLPTLASGTYTPTAVALNNIDSVTTYQCQYMRVGNVVTVSGRLDIDPTAVGATTRFSLSLPISSAFGSSSRAGGTCASNGDPATEQSFAIYAVGSVVWFDGRNTTASNIAHWFSFTYLVS
jgi:hypothetical protein